jgi:hypothetical protein
MRPSNSSRRAAGGFYASFYLEEKGRLEICRDAGLTDAQLRIIVLRAKERFRGIFSGGLRPETTEGWRCTQTLKVWISITIHCGARN